MTKAIFQKTLVIVITLVASCSALLVPLQAEAATRSALSERKKAIYKDATAKYWGDRGQLGGVPCQPSNLNVRHYYFSGEKTNWAAYAMLYGAWPEGPNGDFVIPETDYCTLHFNRRVKEDSRSACVTFIHEYGHLLGKDHNNNISDIMYDGFANYSGTKSQRLFWRHMKIQLAKTKCGKLNR